MLELAFFFAVLAWVVLLFFEWLSTLPAAATIFSLLVAVPVISVLRYDTLRRDWHLDFLSSCQPVLPPQRYNWWLYRKRVLRSLCLLPLAGLPLFFVAIIMPARWLLAPVSLAGWIAAIGAGFAFAEWFARAWLYLRSAQRMDCYAPNFVGWLRRLMYRMSDNPEFLGGDPVSAEEKQKMESIY